MYNILVVDDDADLRLSVSSALMQNDCNVDEAVDGENALKKIFAGAYDLVLMDVNMPKMSGLEALKEIKAHDPSTIVIIMTAYSNIPDAVTATKEGAYNYLEKPIRSDNLIYIVEKAIKAQKLVKNLSYSAPIIQLPGETQFVGTSSEMKQVFSVIDKLTHVDTPVLIRGESGTGKELVAQALHFNSPRKENRFVTVNCSAIPEGLVESEFFGHEKGSFTGADSRKIGKFQYADGGTIFLDEIGDIPLSMQVKLLRVLQEMTFTPVGANREVEVNVRIVAATNRNLEKMIETSEFREDLFYRLNVLPINLPPLRERKNDVPDLVGYFIDKFNLKYTHKKIEGLSDAARVLLSNYDWPGNIRELENVIEHAFVIEGTNQITPESLPATLVTAKNRAGGGNTPVPPSVGRSLTTNALGKIAESGSDGISLDTEKLDFQQSKEEFEKQFLITALKTFGGKINQTAIHANIPKKTLLRKLEKYGIRARDFSI